MINTMKAPSRAPLPLLEPQTDMVLRLLTQVILADGHVCSSEIDALVRGAGRLKLKDKFGGDLSDANIRDWFDDYQHILNTETPALRKDVALTHMILKLADWPEKQAVLNVLREISFSDMEFHLEEKTLISIVQAYWQFEGLDTQSAKIVT